jgi:hypothetical protein
MCSRDDEVKQRYCTFCGQSYYGDLGHRNCPAFSEKTEPKYPVTIEARNKARKELGLPSIEKVRAEREHPPKKEK